MRDIWSALSEGGVVDMGLEIVLEMTYISVVHAIYGWIVDVD